MPSNCSCDSRAAFFKCTEISAWKAILCCGLFSRNLVSSLGPLIPNVGGSEFIDLLNILKTEYDSVVHMCMSVIRNGPTAMAGVGLNLHGPKGVDHFERKMQFFCSHG